MQWFVRVQDQLWICDQCHIRRCWGIGYRPREVAEDLYKPLLQCRGACRGATRHSYVGVANAVDATDVNSWAWSGQQQSNSISAP